MRLLDRYLLRELVIPLTYCVSGFLIFWISFDLFSELDKLHERKLSAGQIVRYYLIHTPEFLALALPIALLLGMLYSLSNHARHNEIVAMRNAGVGIWRIAAPYLAMGLFFSGLVFALNELALPNAARSVNALYAEAAGSAEDVDWKRNVHFLNAQAERIWNIGAFNPRTGEMLKPQVEWRTADGGRRVLMAEHGRYQSGEWVFKSVQQLTYPPRELLDDVTPTRHATLAAPIFDETPAQIETYLKFSALTAREASKRPTLSLKEVNFLRSSVDLNPQSRAMLETQYHARLAAPWTCFVVALIAVPIAATSNRRNAFVGVASSIGICFAFFILMRLGLALGTSGITPPWLGAWAPNVLFAATGCALTFAAR